MAGLTFDEFRVGQVFTHQPSRTVTEADNLLFSALTMNPQPLHIDAEFAKTSHFGQRLVLNGGDDLDRRVAVERQPARQTPVRHHAGGPQDDVGVELPALARLFL